LSRQTSVLDIFEPSSRTLASPRVLFDTGVNDPDDPPTLQEQVPRPEVVISYFLQLFHTMNIILRRTGLSGTIHPHFNKIRLSFAIVADH